MLKEFSQTFLDISTITRRIIPESRIIKPEVVFDDEKGLTIVQLTGDADTDQPVAAVITRACKENEIDPVSLRLLLSKEFTKKNGVITTIGPEVDSHGRRTEYVVERRVNVGGRDYYVRDDALYQAVVEPDDDGNDFAHHDNATEVILGTGITPARLLIATNIQRRTDAGGYTTSVGDTISVAVNKNTLIISNKPSKWVAIPPAVLPKAAFNMRYINIVRPGMEDTRARVVVAGNNYSYKDLVAAEIKMPTKIPLTRIAI